MQTKAKAKPKRKTKPQHTKAAAKKRAAPAKAVREEKEQIPKQSFLKRLIFRRGKARPVRAGGRFDNHSGYPLADRR